MATMRCNTCGGVYDDVLPDGLLYFHACPPLSVAELRAAIAAKRAVLTPAQLAELQRLDAIAVPVVTPENYVAPGDVYLARFAVARPNARDENLAALKGDEKPTIKAAGAGVTVLTP